MAKQKLLIVDDNPHVVRSLERILEKYFAVEKALNSEKARSLFLRGVDIVLLDINLGEGGEHHQREGIALLEEFLEIKPHVPIVMISAYGDLATAVDCMRRGAADFISKPPNPEELVERLQRTLRNSQAVEKARHLENQLQKIAPIQLIGKSRAIQEIRQFVREVAKDPYATVFIFGETGTGKELIARLIHYLGKRSHAPYVAVSLASLNPNLVESELFGHVKGAFAGAYTSRIGFIEKAKGGVLFLDEIGELSQEVQVKLLRFLEERVIYPVGSSEPVEVDLQILTATHRDLWEEVQKGNFREDLYYRLQVIPIHLPPLRERKEDIPLLAEHFLNLLKKQGRTKLQGFSQEAIEVMMQYSWPGNIRQLKNEVERAALFAWMRGRKYIEAEDLSLPFLTPSSSQPLSPEVVGSASFSLDRELSRWELYYIQEALKKSKGKKSEAWKLLGLNDRYALTRRVKGIVKKYPDLIRQFPLLEKLYARQISSLLDSNM